MTGLNRSVATLLAIIVIVSTLSPFAATIATADPAGMTTVPDDQITTDMPKNSKSFEQLGITVEDLEGSVYAEAGKADTLEVILTTPGRAKGKMGVENVLGSGPIAIVFRDDTDSSGRTIAVDEDVLRKALDRSPKMARGTHENGEIYRDKISYEDGVGKFEIDHFSSNTVTFSGEVNITGSYSDGSSVSYNISDLDSATDPNIKLTGEMNTESETVSESSLSDTSSFSANVAGSAEPTGPSANNEPEVTFTGVTQNNSRTLSNTGVSPTGTDSYTIDGNLEPTGPSSNNEPEITVTSNGGLVGTHNIVNDEGDGATDGTVSFIGGSDGSPLTVNVEIVPSSTGYITEVRYYIGDVTGSGYDPSVDVRIDSGDADSTGGDGTLVKTGHMPTWDTGWHTVQLDEPYKVSSGSTYEIEFDTTSISASNFEAMNAGYDSSPSTTKYTAPSEGWTYDRYGQLEVDIEEGTNNLDVSDDDGNSATIETLKPGESKTVETSFITTGSEDVAFSGSGASVDYSLPLTERTGSENPSVDIDGDGTIDASYSGVLSSGSTATKEIPNLSTSDDSWNVSVASDSVVDISTSYTERTVTLDPSVSVNGEQQASISGTLANGTSKTITGNKSALVEGSNTVDVSVGGSLSADAPPSSVEIDYTHDAEDKQSVNYTSEKWSEKYNVSRTYADATTNANLTIPHEGNVVAIDTVEKSVNDGTWKSVDSANYQLDGTTLTVQLGDLSSGDKVEIRTTGRRVIVVDGSITVVEPTTTGDRLDTKIRLDSWPDGAHIGVGGTPDGRKIHYTYNEDSGGDEYVRIKGNGAQQLYIPAAADGSEMRVSTIPVEADVQTGLARFEVRDAKTTEPQFRVEPAGTSDDDVEFTFVDAKDDQKYVLYSKTQGVVRDSGKANSPITLTDDDSEETLQFQEEDEGTGGSDEPDGPLGPVEPQGDGPLNSVPIILIAYAGVLIALYLVDRGGTLAFRNPIPSMVPFIGGRRVRVPLPGSQGPLFWGGSVLLTLIVLEFFSSGLISRTIFRTVSGLTDPLGEVVPLAGIVAVGLLAYYLYRRFIVGQNNSRDIIIRSDGGDER